jgi:hypothetical protein
MCPASDWRAFTIVVRFSLFVPRAPARTLHTLRPLPARPPHASLPQPCPSPRRTEYVGRISPAAPPLTPAPDPARAQGRRQGWHPRARQGERPSGQGPEAHVDCTHAGASIQRQVTWLTHRSARTAAARLSTRTRSSSRRTPTATTATGPRRSAGPTTSNERRVDDAERLRVCTLAPCAGMILEAAWPRGDNRACRPWTCAAHGVWLNVTERDKYPRQWSKHWQVNDAHHKDCQRTRDHDRPSVSVAYLSINTTAM